MLLITLAELAWTIVGILGPLYILALYPLFERTKLCSPGLVVPGIIGLALFFYFFWGPGLHYSHFLVGAGVFLSVYLPNIYRWGYRSTDAFVLSALATLAADQLWQLPIYVEQWSQSTANFVFGLSGAGLSMMSLPLWGYFLMRTGKPRMDTVSRVALCVASMLSISLLSVYWVQTFDYLAFFAWAEVFALACRASSKAGWARQEASRALSLNAV